MGYDLRIQTGKRKLKTKHIDGKKKKETQEQKTQKEKTDACNLVWRVTGSTVSTTPLKRLKTSDSSQIHHRRGVTRTFLYPEVKKDICVHMKKISQKQGDLREGPGPS